MNNRLKKAHVAATLNVGISTKNKTHACHSDMADAKAPRTTLPAKRLANINARIQLFKNVSLAYHFLKILISLCD